MMRGIISTVYAVVALFLVLLFYRYVPAAELLAPTEAGTLWQRTVHISSNALYMQHPTLLHALLHACSVDPIKWYVPIVLIIWGTGIAFLGMRYLGRSLPESAAAASIGVLVLVLLFGEDRLVVAPLCWLPWCAAAAAESLRGYSWIRFLLLSVLAACLLAVSSQQFALFTAVSALLLARFLSGRQQVDSLRWSFLCAAVLFPAVLATAVVPLPQLPEYPPLSHVVEDDNLPGDLTPMIGKAPSVSLLDRAFIKQTYGPFGLLIFVCAVLGYLTVRQKREDVVQWFWAAGLFGACIAVDGMLAEEFSVIGPLAVLARLIPGLLFVSPVPLAAAIALSLLLIGFLQAGRLSAMILAAGVLLLPAYNSGSSGHPGVRAALLHFPSLQRVDLGIWNEQQRLAFLPGSTRARLRDRLFSPSFHVIHTEGLYVAEEAERLSHSEFRGIEPGEVELRASRHNSTEQLAAAVDGDLATRWSSGAGGQKGEEWLHLAFKAPVHLHGIELATGSWHADFPRGLEIRYAAKCQAEKVDFNQYQVIRTARPWLGRFAFTDTGMPYYGSQSDVKVYFPKKVLAACLLIRQTGLEPVFDWSVAEVRILTSELEARS